VGYYQIYSDPALNFRFNFWYNCYYAGTGDDSMLSEMKSFAPLIKTYDDWKSQFLKMAEKAMSNGETLKAAYYYRGAEFIMLPSDPQKQPTRQQFLQLTRSFYGLDDLRFTVPYTDGNQSGNLPGYRLTPANPKGTLVMFGGYDSYIEELVPQAFVFRDAGYDVVLFEGPGQGGALEDYGLTMTPEWEKPVAAVLDHFGLDSVSLMGISLGGYLVIRAAAFEPRVQRAIADDVIYSFSGCMWSALSTIDADVLHTLYVGNSVNPLDGMAFNALVERGMQGSLYTSWAINQGMHVFGLKTPFELFRTAENYSAAGISGQVNQEVLLLAGSKDLDVPVQMFYSQIAALPNVSSLTARLFTEAEQAQNHCQVGNIGLQLNYIVDWLDSIE
jgi:pimeloyl-ACP methyl ester carboxylesterase